MSTCLFSVCMGTVDRSPLISNLIDTMSQIERGIIKLMDQLHLTSQLELRRSVCSERKEWIAVHLREGAQQNLFERMDTTMGSGLTIPEIEGMELSFQVKRTMQTLHTLHRERVWQSNDFLASVEQLNLTDTIRTITSHWPSEGGQVSVRTVDGLTSITNVPNRLFSARSDQIFSLTFRPRLVGRQSASVTLDHESSLLIQAQSRSIQIFWSADDEMGPAKSLMDSALTEIWMTGVFSVVRNRHRRAKSLLLADSSSLARYDRSTTVFNPPVLYQIDANGYDGHALPRPTNE